MNRSIENGSRNVSDRFKTGKQNGPDSFKISRVRMDAAKTSIGTVKALLKQFRHCFWGPEAISHE
jgi:hypothetical protein